MHAAQFIVKKFQRSNGPKRDVGQQFDHILLYWFINVFVRQRNLGSWGLASGCIAGALPKEWVMEETFKTKLLQTSRTRPAQKCKEQIQDYVSLLTFPSYFFSMDFTRSIKQQRLFESLRELLLVNQLCVSCMHGACQRRSRVEVWRCLLKSKYPWLEILALTARCGL